MTNKEPTSIDIIGLHRVLQDGLFEVHQICVKHNIGYIMLAGTMLGARRHKGFIPWDDDLDIGMLRSDYEKFCRIAAVEMSDTYYLQIPNTDDNAGVAFAKLRKNGTTIIEEVSKATNGHKGIYIDIFPLDEVPVSKIMRCAQAIRLQILQILLAYSADFYADSYGGSVQRIVKKYVLKPLAKITPRSWIVSMISNFAIAFNGQGSQHVVALGGSYGYKRETLLRSWVTDRILYKFNDFEFYGPKDSHGYLSHLYGDYLRMPDLHEQVPRHQILRIDFGDH